MKRILAIIVVLVTFAGIANAQISIKKSEVGRPVQVAVLSPFWSWLDKIDDYYFVSMKSSNQFDDVFVMRIGKTQEECLESISSLIDLAKTIKKEDSFEIDNGLGQVYNVSQYGDFGATGLLFQAEGHAGHGYLLMSNMTKAQKWIQKNLQ